MVFLLAKNRCYKKFILTKKWLPEKTMKKQPYNFNTQTWDSLHSSQKFSISPHFRTVRVKSARVPIHGLPWPVPLTGTIEPASVSRALAWRIRRWPYDGVVTATLI